MEKTKIEWADSSWNPVTGCENNCPYCYARTLVNRFKMSDYKGDKIELFEPVTDEGGKKIPYPANFIPTFHRYRLGDYKSKKGRTIFVCSMADMFGDWIPDSWIRDVFRACLDAPQHRYLFLTKNPNRYVELADKGLLISRNNFWYGTTVTTENQEFFYAKGYKYNTFLSIEPIHSKFERTEESMERAVALYKEGLFPKWIIFGAETGNRKGKVIPKKDWIEGVTVVCDKLYIPVFMKESMVSVVGEENMRREFPWKN